VWARSGGFWLEDGHSGTALSPKSLHCHCCETLRRESRFPWTRIKDTIELRRIRVSVRPFAASAQSQLSRAFASSGKIRPPVLRNRFTHAIVAIRVQGNFEIAPELNRP
jgi:hypothetical protein